MALGHNYILGLQLFANARWANVAELQLENIITNYTFCEQKPTTACISIVQFYQYYIKLVQQLATIVSIEWALCHMYTLSKSIAPNKYNKCTLVILAYYRDTSNNTTMIA
jgi:tRNA isopentenyl-2-thiomethyl-A-37 hydroxylase MiaE